MKLPTDVVECPRRCYRRGAGPFSPAGSWGHSGDPIYSRNGLGSVPHHLSRSLKSDQQELGHLSYSLKSGQQKLDHLSRSLKSGQQEVGHLSRSLKTGEHELGHPIMFTEKGQQKLQQL